MSNKEVVGFGIVTDQGDLKMYEPMFFKGQASNRFRGKEIQMVITEKTKKRSNPQLAYYFGVLVRMIRDHLLESGTKFSVEQIDTILRENFLFEEEVGFITGEIRRVPMALNGRKTKVDTKMMMQFFADIQQWAVEKIDLYLPDPSEEVKKHK